MDGDEKRIGVLNIRDTRDSWQRCSNWSDGSKVAVQYLHFSNFHSTFSNVHIIFRVVPQKCNCFNRKLIRFFVSIFCFHPKKTLLFNFANFHRLLELLVWFYSLLSVRFSLRFLWGGVWKNEMKWNMRWYMEIVDATELWFFYKSIRKGSVLMNHQVGRDLYNLPIDQGHCNSEVKESPKSFLGAQPVKNIIEHPVMSYNHPEIWHDIIDIHVRRAKLITYNGTFWGKDHGKVSKFSGTILITIWSRSILARSYTIRHQRFTLIIFPLLLTNQPPINHHPRPSTKKSLHQSLAPSGKSLPCNSSGMGSSSGMASISATKASASFSSAAAFLGLVEILEVLVWEIYESISCVASWK